MELRVGQYAKSKAGRDKDKIYVIIRIEEEYVYLVDGLFKPIHKPKKKKIKHIQGIDCINSNFQVNDKDNTIFSDVEIKKAMKAYKANEM